MVLGEMRTFPLICLFTYLLSFVNEAFRPANSAAIAFYSKDENRSRSYALNRLAVNLGWAVGSSIGGYLASINYALLFWVDGCTNIAAAMLMLALLKPVHLPKQEKTTADTKPVLPAHSDKGFLYFIIVTLFFAACFFQLFTNLPVYFKNEVQLSGNLSG